MSTKRVFLGVVLAAAAMSGALASTVAGPGGTPQSPLYVQTAAPQAVTLGSLSAPGLIALVGQAIPLLTNATATGSTYTVPAGGAYAYSDTLAGAGITGASLSLTVTPPNNGAPVTVSEASLIANNCVTLAGGSTVKMTVTGTPSAAINATLAPYTGTSCPVANQGVTEANSAAILTKETAIASNTSAIATNTAALATAANQPSLVNGSAQVIIADNGAISQPLNMTSTSNALVITLPSDRATLAFTITGLTASGGQITLQYQNGDGTWYAKKIPALSSAVVTADGGYRVNIAGHTKIEFLVSTAGTGSAAITYNTSQAAGDVAATIVQPSATTIDSSASVTTASTPVVAASTGTRMRVDIANNALVGSGNNAWCRTDGGTAAVNVGNEVYAGGQFEWLYPTVGPAAINCIMTSATATLSYEAFQ